MALNPFTSHTPMALKPFTSHTPMALKPFTSHTPMARPVLDLAAPPPLTSPPSLGLASPPPLTLRLITMLWKPLSAAARVRSRM